MPPTLVSSYTPMYREWCPFIIVIFVIVKLHYCEKPCAGKLMGRHINIKHQNPTAFINLRNLYDQKFVSVITISYGLGLGVG